MNTERNREISSVIKFMIISIAIMIFGFFVMNKNFMPMSNQEVVNSSYEVLVEQLYSQLRSDMLMINSIYTETLKYKSFYSLNDETDSLINLNANIENIHLIQDSFYIYDGSKIGDLSYLESDWFLEASDSGYISDPYLDPISGEDIITFSYVLPDDQKTIIAYDVAIRKIIQYVEDLTHETIFLSFNAQQRIYSTKGFVVDEAVLDTDNTIHTTFLDDRYQMIYVNKDHVAVFSEVISGFPSVFIVTSVILAFVIYVIYHYSLIMMAYYNDLNKPLKSSHFIDLIELKKKYKEIATEHKILETEKSVLAKIKITEHERVIELRQEIKSKETQISKLKEHTTQFKEQLSVIADATPALVWITDSNDNITFLNAQLKQKHNTGDSCLSNITDLIEDFDASTRLLKKRDYNKIRLKIKGNHNSEALSGKTKRLFYDNALKAILYMTNTSNFDSKLQNNYLKKSRDLHFINEITKIINSNNDIELILQEVIDKVAFLGNFNSCSIRLINDNKILDMVASSGYSLEHIYREELSIDERHIGIAYEEDRVVVINTISDMQIEEPFISDIVTKGRSVAYLPLSNFNRSFGVLGVVSDFPFNSDTLVMLESIAINVTISLEKLVLYDQLKSNYFKTVEAFVNATEIKSDRYTGHSRRVAEVCSLIADRLFLSKSEADEIFISGLLHDVGKLAFQDDSTEYLSDVNEHGYLGKEMIENVGLSDEILDGIAYHHMNFDEKLIGEENGRLMSQPYYAQIIRIANDFDIFVYKDMEDQAYSHFFERHKFKEGVQYAPQIFQALKDITIHQKDKIETIYKNRD